MSNSNTNTSTSELGAMERSHHVQQSLGCVETTSQAACAWRTGPHSAARATLTSSGDGFEAQNWSPTAEERERVGGVM